MSCDRRCEDPRDEMHPGDGSPDCMNCSSRDAGQPYGLTREESEQLAESCANAIAEKMFAELGHRGNESNVVHATFGTPGHLEASMADELMEVIYSYAERVSVAQVIGVLEVLKIEILEG